MSRDLRAVTVDQPRPSPLAWLEILLCVLPSTAGWAWGFVAALGLCVASMRASDGPATVLTALILAGLGCALFGLCSLWSLLLPRALGRHRRRVLRHWHWAGLSAGLVASGIGLIELLSSSSNERSRFLLAWLYSGPVLVGLHVAWQSALRDLWEFET
jgi:hypothetical protein